MRLLLVNPNTTEALTERLAASARAVLPEGVELILVTAREGFPYISSRAEAQIAGAEVLTALAERHGEVDAAVIAAFGDPGLRAARELFDMPITGMTEASMLIACSLGERFAFVTFTPALGPWYSEQVRIAGLDSRFAGFHTPDGAFADIKTVAGDLKAPLTEVCRVAARIADVVILAGAPIAGLASEIRGDVDAVLLDPVQAAVVSIVGLHRLAPDGASLGPFARPSAKPSTVPPDALSRLISRGSE